MNSLSRLLLKYLWCTVIRAYIEIVYVRRTLNQVTPDTNKKALCFQIRTWATESPRLAARTTGCTAERKNKTVYSQRVTCAREAQDDQRWARLRQRGCLVRSCGL